jgi:hypothetical protein
VKAELQFQFCNLIIVLARVAHQSTKLVSSNPPGGLLEDSGSIVNLQNVQRKRLRFQYKMVRSM